MFQSKHTSDWVGNGGARLSAILLVLFVNEGLEAKGGADGVSEPTILGLGMQEVYDMLKASVAASQVTREQLLQAVMDEDIDGSATEFAQSNQLSEALYEARFFPNDATSGPPGVVRPSLRAVWRNRVTARYLLQAHSWLAIAGGVWVSGWSAVWPPDRRTTVVSTALALGMLSMSVMFPTSAGDKAHAAHGVPPLNSKVGAQMLLPLVFTSGVSAACVVWYDFWHTTQVNAACQAVHALLGVAAVINGFVGIVLTACERTDWSVVRRHFAADGVAFLLATLALRFLGPPVVYPPGGVDFGSACARGITTLGLAIVFTASNRVRARGVAAVVARLAGVQMEPLVLSMIQALDEENEPIAESARINELKGWGSGMQRMVRQRLARRYMMLQLLICILCGVWFVLAENLGLWRTLGVALGSEHLRMFFFACIMCSAVLVVAASFPATLHSTAGRTFLLPVLIVIAVSTGYFAFYSYSRDGVLTHVNDACRQVHLGLCVGATLVWLVPPLMCATGRLTWGVIRLVFVFDGLTWIVAALAMNHLGPPPFFLPHNVSLSESALRSAITPMVAAFLTARNRVRIADLANRIGLNHVSVTLRQCEAEPSSSTHDQPRSAASSVSTKSC